MFGLKFFLFKSFSLIPREARVDLGKSFKKKGPKSPTRPGSTLNGRTGGAAVLTK